jgi:hypothetical protein
MDYLLTCSVFLQTMEFTKLGREAMKVTATNPSLLTQLARGTRVRDIAIGSDMSMRYSIRPRTFEGA